MNGRPTGTHSAVYPRAGARRGASLLRRPAGRQRGAIIPLFVASLLALLGMAGLALDLGHFYLNRERLQTALDAAALSGARTLNETRDTALAAAAAKAAFTLNANAAENAELQAIGEDAVLVSFATHLEDEFSDDGGANPRFLRARVEGFSTAPWLVQLLGIGSLDQPASAVAGPRALRKVCGLLPMAACGTAGAANFGYSTGTEYPLKTGSGATDWDVGPGNYRNLRLDEPGADSIRRGMAEGIKRCILSDGTGDLTTEPGNNVGPNAQGLNSRFGCPPPPRGCESAYPPDKVIDAGASGYPDSYSDYRADLADRSKWDYFPPEAADDSRRVVAVPVIDCSGTTNGRGTVTVLGVACMFLTRPAEQTGNQEIYGEFINSCPGIGSPGTGPGSFFTIVLYKDFAEGAADR